MRWQPGFTDRCANAEGLAQTPCASFDSRQFEISTFLAGRCFSPDRTCRYVGGMSGYEEKLRRPQRRSTWLSLWLVLRYTRNRCTCTMTPKQSSLPPSYEDNITPHWIAYALRRETFTCIEENRCLPWQARRPALPELRQGFAEELLPPKGKICSLTTALVCPHPRVIYTPTELHSARNRG